MQARANPKEEGPGNHAGANIYIDRSCSGCGTCRSICPGVFGTMGMRTAIQRPPQNEPETRAAYRAMVTCPVGAIRLRRPDPLVKDVVMHDFPTPVDAEALPGVYLLGYHNKESFGTTPYLIVREGGAGNVMIDAPRFNGRLAHQIEALGGIRYNVITHEGAAPHHDMWHAFFPASERVVHRMDVTRDMKGAVEAVLNGKGPWTIDDDVKIVALPGYSQGAIGVIYHPGGEGGGNDNGVLFSGRTIGWSPKLNQLDGFAQFTRGNLLKQAHSMKALSREEFSWILPAEGIKYQVPEGGAEAKERLLHEAAERFLQRGRAGGVTM